MTLGATMAAITQGPASCDGIFVVGSPRPPRAVTNDAPRPYAAASMSTALTAPPAPRRPRAPINVAPLSGSGGLRAVAVEGTEGQAPRPARPSRLRYRAVLRPTGQPLRSDAWAAVVAECLTALAGRPGSLADRGAVGYVGAHDTH